MQVDYALDADCEPEELDPNAKLVMEEDEKESMQRYKQQMMHHKLQDWIQHEHAAK